MDVEHERVCGFFDSMKMLLAFFGCTLKLEVREQVRVEVASPVFLTVAVFSLFADSTLIVVGFPSAGHALGISRVSPSQSFVPAAAPNKLCATVVYLVVKHSLDLSS